MRIYPNCNECIPEVERDLFEMGIEVRGYSMQDKIVQNDEAFFTKELSPAMFQVTNPCPDMDVFLQYFWGEDEARLGAAMRWAHGEFEERIASEHINPGQAWTHRNEVWTEFIHNGKFQYSYNERLRPQLTRVIKELKDRPSSRQAILEIHNNLLDIGSMGGISRIPCSLHYQILVRDERVDLIYVMRSTDFLTHFGFDNWLAIRMQKYIADQLHRKVGRYTFFTASLHSYYKDMKKRGIF